VDGQPSKPRMATNRVHRPQHREHLPRAISLSCAVPDWELDRRGRYFRFAGDTTITGRLACPEFSMTHWRSSTVSPSSCGSEATPGVPSQPNEDEMSANIPVCVIGSERVTRQKRALKSSQRTPLDHPRLMHLSILRSRQFPRDRRVCHACMKTIATAQNRKTKTSAIPSHCRRAGASNCLRFRRP